MGFYPRSGTVFDESGAATQLLLLEGEGGSGRGLAAGVFGRSSGGLAYGGGITAEGELQIILAIGSDGYPGDVTLASVQTSLDPSGSDIHLQLDLFGTTAALTAWAEGATKPAAPQLFLPRVMAATEGSVGALGQRAVPSMVVYRYFETRVPFTVVIDIKPGSDVNPINLSQGVTPVAILGSDQFDVADVATDTLAFGPDGAAPSHKVGSHFEDVNNDGLLDLVSHYRTQEAGIALGDPEACVTGRTLDGLPLSGCDHIQTHVQCGLGFELVLLLPPLMWLAGRRRAELRCRTTRLELPEKCGL